MMSEMLLKKLGGLDAPRPPSAARLAAEAFFDVPSTTAPDKTDPTVVVRRRETPAADGEPSVEAPSEAPETRAPRVFRIDSAATAAAASVESAVEQSPRPIADAVPATPPPRRMPRKKARRLHGEVTIIRPEQSVTAEASEAHMPAEADDAWPHYPKLMARIRELEAEAKVLREREAAAALEWIRQAIATYGLTEQDLGLRTNRR